MTRLNSWIFFGLILILSVFVSANTFGSIQDEEGNPVEPTSTNDYGGLVYSVPEQAIAVNYGGDTVDYSGLSGDVVFSDQGKLVEGEVEVEEGGEYVFGNLKLELEKGAKVVFKDGELKIEDPGEMPEKGDVEFVESDDGWDDTEIKLSGDGVDLYGLSEVGLDESGYYLDSPQDFEFDDFIITAEGKVYIDESGDGASHSEYPGTYISVNAAEKKFTIGSNAFDEAIAVKVKPENKYDLMHDVASDHLAFKSMGGGQPSFVTVQGRSGEYLTPRVDTAGYFAIDDNQHGVYMGSDNNIYTTYQGTGTIAEFPAPSTSTPSPIQIDFYDYQGDQLARMSDYGGSLVIGNDGSIGYGSDPAYTIAGKWGESELHHGASNLLAYNYYKGGKETIEQLFGFSFHGNRVDVLNDPKEGKWFMDILFQTPYSVREHVRSVKLASNIGAYGRAHTSGDIEFAVPKGWSTRTISHELAHIFDFNTGRGYGGRLDTSFSRAWHGINGDRLPIVNGAYTDIRVELVSTFVEQQYRPLSYWDQYRGNAGVQKRVAACMVGDGITFFSGQKILNRLGAGPINNMEDVNRVLNS